jgi:Protein of unknown function (DUF433)
MVPNDTAVAPSLHQGLAVRLNSPQLDSANLPVSQRCTTPPPGHRGYITIAAPDNCRSGISLRLLPESSLDGHERITSASATLFGRPHITGRRIGVDCILDILASGWPRAQMLRAGTVRCAASNTLVGRRLKRDAGCGCASICADIERGPAPRRAVNRPTCGTTCLAAMRSSTDTAGARHGGLAPSWSAAAPSPPCRERTT